VAVISPSTVIDATVTVPDDRRPATSAAPVDRLPLVTPPVTATFNAAERDPVNVISTPVNVSVNLAVDAVNGPVVCDALVSLPPKFAAPAVIAPTVVNPLATATPDANRPVDVIMPVPPAPNPEAVTTPAWTNEAVTVPVAVTLPPKFALVASIGPLTLNELTVVLPELNDADVKSSENLAAVPVSVPFAVIPATDKCPFVLNPLPLTGPPADTSNVTDNELTAAAPDETMLPKFAAPVDETVAVVNDEHVALVNDP